MFDTHAHLHDPAFEPDRDAVVARAQAAGVVRILTVGCDLSDSARALETAAQRGLDATVGIHPHEAKEAPADINESFDRLIAGAAKRPLAVGETGLDYYYDHSPRETQREVFRTQIRYARRLGLPLVFHQRDAFDDFVKLLREEFAAPMRGVVHSFTGTRDDARLLVQEFGLLLGIGGILTFKNAGELRAAVAETGLGHLILETDAPYLAPVPYRGRRNEPAYVAATAQALAELLELDLSIVVAQTTENATALFGSRDGRKSG